MTPTQFLFPFVFRFFVCFWKCPQLIEAFGYMGGYIGMWLGLSLFKLITDAERWIRKYLLERAIQKAKERVIGNNNNDSNAVDASNAKLDSLSQKSKAVYSMSTGYGQVM